MFHQMTELAYELSKDRYLYKRGYINNRWDGEWIMSIKIENLTHLYMPGTPFEKKALDNINLRNKRWRIYCNYRTYRFRKI